MNKKGTLYLFSGTTDKKSFSAKLKIQKFLAGGPRPKALRGSQKFFYLKNFQFRINEIFVDSRDNVQLSGIDVPFLCTIITGRAVHYINNARPLGSVECIICT